MGIIISLKRKLHPFCYTPTGWKIIFFGLLSCLSIYMLYQLFENKEPNIKIIILNKDKHMKLLAAGNNNNGWVWRVTGFEYYNNLNESPQQIRNIIPKSKNYNDGLWIYRKNSNNQTKQQKYSSSSVNKNLIELTKFQYEKPKEIMLGLRYYISGSGRIEIKLTDVYTGGTETFALIQDEDEDKISEGFCSKIISPGFNRLIDKIEIRAYTTKETSLIVIDEVIVTVADGDSSRSLIYTLIPNQWCEVQNNNVMKIKKKPRRRKDVTRVVRVKKQ